jgi:DnaJ-class molecular chaperone
MKLKIKCPACSGKGKLKVLDGQICSYCQGEKNVLLATYLKTLNKKQELANVLHFQKRTAKKQHPVHEA